MPVRPDLYDATVRAGRERVLARRGGQTGQLASSLAPTAPRARRRLYQMGTGRPWTEGDMRLRSGWYEAAEQNPDHIVVVLVYPERPGPATALLAIPKAALSTDNPPPWGHGEIMVVNEAKPPP